MPQATQLIYVHDPMCSWCWGFKPVFDTLCERTDGGLEVCRLLGGLATDSDQPMPAGLQLQLQDTWRRIQQRIPDTRFNFDFWTNCAPRRSTWPACRAVIAARELDPTQELPMITAIQHAYYLQARNPSDTDTLVELAESLGLDGHLFTERLQHAETHATLAEEIDRARRVGANSFPSLRLQVGTSVWPVAVDYINVDNMRAKIEALLAG